jgi:hypothetical protein
VDLIITGIPRSGTTLATAIIDQVPDAFCLSEPETQIALMEGAETAEEFVTRLGAEFDAVRRQLLAGGTVLDRRADTGKAITNYFGRPNADGRRGVSYAIVPVSRPGLSREFLLGIKHNALYIAVLPEIVKHSRWRIIAVVREPLAVLMSWRSLDLPISQGQLPAAERFWPEMAKLTRAGMDLTEKQIRMCDLLCRRFVALARDITVVPYERFVTDPGALLSACGINTPATTVQVDRRHSAGGMSDSANIIAERIRAMATAGELPGICHFYPSYLAHDRKSATYVVNARNKWR